MGAVPEGLSGKSRNVTFRIWTEGQNSRRRFLAEPKGARFPLCRPIPLRQRPASIVVTLRLAAVEITLGDVLHFEGRA